MTTPATEDEQQALRALEQAMQELGAGQSGGDELTIWRRTREVLELMHSLDDQAHKRLGRAYREVTRRATEDGRTPAALCLVRGIAHHQLSEVRALVLRETTRHVMLDGELVSTKRYVRINGELVETKTRVAVTAWRPLADLPPSPEPLHDRDTYYAQHVEGRGLMEPLLAAQRSLAGL